MNDTIVLLGLDVHEESMLALRAVACHHTQWCFTYQGRRMDAVGSAWKRALRRAEIENFRFHDLRHYSALTIIPMSE